MANAELVAQAQLEQLNLQTQIVWHNSRVQELILSEQLQTTGALHSVGEAIRNLGALFDWKLEQLNSQFSAQTQRLDGITQLLARPLDTQAKELWERAQFAAQRGWIDESVQSYKQAIEKSPFLYPAHLQLGFLYAYKRYDFDSAIESFRLAARYAETDDPASAAQAHLHVHKILREQGRLEESWRHVSRACELDPTLAPGWWDRATLAAELAIAGEAEASLRRAISLDFLYWHRAKQFGNWWTFASRCEELLALCAAQASDQLEKERVRFTSYVNRARESSSRLMAADAQAIVSRTENSVAALAASRQVLGPGDYAFTVTRTREISATRGALQRDLLALISEIESRVRSEIIESRSQSSQQSDAIGAQIQEQQHRESSSQDDRIVIAFLLFLPAAIILFIVWLIFRTQVLLMLAMLSAFIAVGMCLPNRKKEQKLRSERDALSARGDAEVAPSERYLRDAVLSVARDLR
jgi:tetratricopeptide (TPR) repeat protein